MNKKIKSLVSLFVVTLAFLPLKSHAAFMVAGGIVGLAGDSELGAALAYSALLPIFVGMLSVLAGVPVGIFKIYLLMALGVDGQLSQTQLQKNIAEHYNFLDNQEIVVDLATQIKKQYEIVKDKNGNAIVSLSEASIRKALEPAALSESEIEQVVRDLN